MATTSSTVAHPIPQPTQPRSLASQMLNGLYEIGVGGGAGALAGWACSIIDPIGGAVFGVSSAFTGVLANTLSERLCMDHTAARVAVWAVSFVASIAVGIIATAAAGFPLTVLGAVGMTLAMLVSSFVVRFGIACVGGCFGAPAGGARFC